MAITPRHRLADLIQASITKRLRLTHVATPAIIQSYDAASQTCSAAISIGDNPPIVSAVPVFCLSGDSGSATLSMPIRAGDPCLLLFADSSLDAWKASSGGIVQAQEDPTGTTQHTYTDAIALVGIYPPSIAPSTRPDAATLAYGASAVVLTPSTIALGSGGVEIVSVLIDALSAIVLFLPSSATTLLPLIAQLQSIQGSL